MASQVGAPPDKSAYQRFTPHRAGLPNLVDYFTLLWRRREFATEMSKARVRGASDNTIFGTAWLLIDPLLQATVYFVMINFIRGHSANGPSAGETIAHLTSSLFAFRLCQGALNTGARSVTGAGKMLLNTNFPRLLIPLSAVRTGFVRFLPTIPLYLVIHEVVGQPWHLTMFGAVYFLGCILVFGMGLSAIAATLTVYFRDFANFLPYIMRLWLYMSPVLWTADQITSKPPAVQSVIRANPMFSMLGGYSNLIQNGHVPAPHVWATAGFWAAASVIVGFLFFISREREFAVRVL